MTLLEDIARAICLSDSDSAPYSCECISRVKCADTLAAARAVLAAIEASGHVVEPKGQWQPIETAPRGKEVLLGYQAEGEVHLWSKYGVGVVTDHMGICDWPWMMEPTHWMAITELSARPKVT